MHKYRIIANLLFSVLVHTNYLFECKQPSILKIYLIIIMCIISERVFGLHKYTYMLTL